MIYRTLAILTLLTLIVAPTADVRAENTTLVGEWIWSSGGQGDLEAVFTPTGEDTWDVSFYFTFRGKDHVYSGIATGKIGEGELSGEVKNDNRKRTFTFSGSFNDDGKFKGVHHETDGKRKDKTGTLKLRS